MSSIKLISARSSAAPWPRSTGNPEPDSFAPALKSNSPRDSPISRCDFALKPSGVTDNVIASSDLAKQQVNINDRLFRLRRLVVQPGGVVPWHSHSDRPAIIYIISGRAEQWCGREHRILGPGEMVLIPKGEVHGTYNPFNERLVFLAILSPANAAEPGIVDVSSEEPWKSMRNGFPPVT